MSEIVLSPGYNEGKSLTKRLASFARIEAMPPDVRQCVHEFGEPIVTVCLKHGITRATAIREIVREIWSGARQAGQRNDAYGTVDWLLMQSGSSLSERGLRRVLAENSMALVSVEPSAVMINASMAEVSGFNRRVTKREKHQLRLRAALRAEMKGSLK